MILSVIAAIILYVIKRDPLFVILFLLVAIFIDIDHYLLYIFRKNNLNLFKAYYYCRNDVDKEFIKEGKNRILCVFHNIEVFLVLLVLSFFISFFVPIVIGYVFHSIIDIIDERQRKVKKSWSIFYYYRKHIFDAKKA